MLNRSSIIKQRPNAAALAARAVIVIVAGGLIAGCNAPQVAPNGVAQQNAVQPGSNAVHRRLPGYTFVDLGTLGGPQSDLQGDSPVLNNRSQAFGFADTSAPSPCYPNCNPFHPPDPYLFHAFAWNRSGLTDLGALPGTNDSEAESAGPNGGATGQSENGTIDPLLGWTESHAVIWSSGKIADLGTLGGYESDAKEMNARGQVTGAAANAVPDQYSILGWGTQTRGFIWQKSTGMRDIGTLGGPDSIGLYLNDRGQIAGCSYTNSTPNSSTGLPTLDPFVWQHNEMKDLGTLGGLSGCVWALSDSGEVSGNSDLAGDQTTHPFLWRHGRLIDLGTLGGTFGIGTWLNNAGQVAGLATTSGDNAVHAFRWARGVMTDLGTLDGYCNSNANGINARGDVVGGSTSCDLSVSHAFLWANGTMIDLNDYVPPSSTLTFGEALFINDRGAIAGHAVLPNRELHAVVLLPTGRSSIAAESHISNRLATANRATPKELLSFILARETRMKHMPFLNRLMRR